MSESLSVLLVEDDPIQRSLAHRILSLEARLSVFTAADGLEGLAFALQHHPQVILLDLILPGISGLELLRRYRDQGGTAKVLALPGAGAVGLRCRIGRRGGLFLPQARSLGRGAAASPFPLR